MEQFPALLKVNDQQPVRYLVVDDSVFARRNLARLIEAFGGAMAGEAGDGYTAITEYDRLNPDIVLMDITMPRMEGIEAAERTALQKGARHFVQKPVKPELLYEVVKYVMGDLATQVQSSAEATQ